MKNEKEVKEVSIVAPDGYEIDKANSTFDKIVFKKKAVGRWRDKTELCVAGFYVDADCDIILLNALSYNEKSYYLFATEKQARSALAMARISQIMANDERFGGVVTDKEWEDTSSVKYIIRRAKNTIVKDDAVCFHTLLAFHTMEQRDLFLEENYDLIKDYLMID